MKDEVKLLSTQTCSPNNFEMLSEIRIGQIGLNTLIAEGVNKDCTVKKKKPQVKNTVLYIKARAAKSMLRDEFRAVVSSLKVLRCFTLSVVGLSFILTNGTHHSTKKYVWYPI